MQKATNAMEAPIAGFAPKAAAAKAAAASHRSRSTKVGPLMLASGLVFALLCVLLIPVLVGGAAPAAGRNLPAANIQNVVEVGSVSEAAELLGTSALRMPTAQPEGAVFSACRVLDETIFEAEYTLGNAKISFRTAAGNGDVSGDYTAYAFTTTETVDGVTRSYAGTSADTLNLAIWAHGGNSYALLAPSGLDADSFRVMAESVK